MAKNGTEAHMTSIPNCDICGTTPAVVDAGTRMGPWAYMCTSCWHLDGRSPGKLGLGIGQKLVKVES